MIRSRRSRPFPAPTRTRSDRRGDAALTVEVGGLIVESAVVADARGRRQARCVDTRWTGRRLSVEDPRTRRDEPERRDRALSRRDLQNLAHLMAFALPIIDVLPIGQSRDVGLLDRLHASGVGPSLVRPTACASTSPISSMADIGRLAREARDCIARRTGDALLGSAWQPLWPVVRRTPHQARGRDSVSVCARPRRAGRAAASREYPLLLDDRRRLRMPISCARTIAPRQSACC